MDFETVLKILALVAAAVAIPVAAYAAIVATRAIWVKGEPGKLGDGGETREELELLRQRMAELEERVDFTERVLARQQEPERLGKGDA
jgi:hypothetical protein